MSAEYTNNHYVPQWYQRQFIPAGQTDRGLYLLDLKPESFREGRGVRRRRKALRRTGTRKCFAVDDLYTTRFGGIESRYLERVFFGEVDARGKQAVEFFAAFDHDRMDEDALPDLMTFMSMQKLRTPKGLDWLAERTGVRRRDDVVEQVVGLRRLYGAIWTECVWQLADATDSPTKFLVASSRSHVEHLRVRLGVGPREVCELLGANRDCGAAAGSAAGAPTASGASASGSTSTRRACSTLSSDPACAARRRRRVGGPQLVPER